MCKIDTGYVGIDDTDRKDSSRRNLQESFFTSETLKYLYLTFTDPKFLDLSRFVFTTTAKPFPILNQINWEEMMH